jgi:hypothetical protein
MILGQWDVVYVIVVDWKHRRGRGKQPMTTLAFVAPWMLWLWLLPMMCRSGRRRSTPKRRQFRRSSKAHYHAISRYHGGGVDDDDPAVIMMTMAAFQHRHGPQKENNVSATMGE